MMKLLSTCANKLPKPVELHILAKLNFTGLDCN